MVEFALGVSKVDVVPAEYKRLLGYPADRVLEGRALELADWARQWYADHGTAWIYAREVESVAIGPESLTINAEEFHCHELLKNLSDAGATRIVVAAVSAGPELEAAAQDAWRDERPDEYFFLEVYGSAVVEHLVTLAGARLCTWAESSQLAVLPHYSPGYGEWNIAEQPRLMRMICDGGALPGPLEAFDTGMLRPKKSLLAVFGLTAAVERASQLSALVPCERCSFTPCQFRRAEYLGLDEMYDNDLAALAAYAGTVVRKNDATARGLVGEYRINRKALNRWANERLTISPGIDGTIEVVFHHEGSTCSNMGRPLLFDYYVRLSAADQGYRILEQECKPAATDVGHRSMCSYLSDPDRVMAAISGEKPLLGSTLDEVLTWQRASTAASCYCDGANRQHMWGQVLETIHYALHRD